MAKSSRAKKISQAKGISPKGSKGNPTKPLPSDSILIKWGPMALLALSAIITLQTRLRLLAIPMERDEAGFAYIGHWLLKGKSLYVDMVDNKLPGLYFLYGFFTTLFGYNATGVHLGLLLTNVVSAVCFFLLLRDLYNRFVAAVGTAFFLILVASPDVAGFAAHATQLLLPFVLGGWLLFWRGIRSGRKSVFFFAGLLLGFAFVIKQQSVVFGILAALLWWPLRLWWNKSERSRWPLMEYILLGIGGVLPVASIAAYFGISGRFDQLYFWSFAQPAGMAATFKSTRMEMFQNTFPKVTENFEAIWIVAALGLILFFISGWKRGTDWFGLLFGLFGLGSVVVGAAFYRHYFVLALPGIALLTGITLYWVSLKAGTSGNYIALALAFILFFWAVIGQREYFFKPDYAKIHQEAYNQNMFPESEKIGHELSKRVAEGERIGIMGSEPGVLVAADRESCTKHLYMYPLLSDPVSSPPMQDEYLQEMKECMPGYIVWNTVSGSWTPGYDQLQIFKRLMQWVEPNYDVIGIAEFRENKPGELIWDEALESHQSQNEYKIYVFKKK